MVAFPPPPAGRGFQALLSEALRIAAIASECSHDNASAIEAIEQAHTTYNRQTLPAA